MIYAFGNIDGHYLDILTGYTSNSLDLTNYMIKMIALELDLRYLCYFLIAERMIEKRRYIIGIVIIGTHRKYMRTNKLVISVVRDFIDFDHLVTDSFFVS